MGKSAYEMNINKGVYTTYLKREMDRSISQEHWTNNTFSTGTFETQSA